MTTLYKLTDSTGRTRAGESNECQWGEGVTHRAQARRGGLCSGQYIHAYLDPHLALLLNPIHASITDPRLWVGEGRIAARDGQLKVGCKSFTTICELPLPAITTAQRVEFAIRCGKIVYAHKGWNSWADKWLSGADRSHGAARAAEAEAAEAAARAAEAEAEAAAEAAAWAATRGAEAAARAATRGAEAAEAAATRGAEAAEAAAAWAAVRKTLDLLAITHQVFPDLER